MVKKIKIKYFDTEIEKIKKIDKGDWIDLRSAENLEYLADSYFKIPTGIGMKLPEDYEMLIAPRGSTFKNFHFIITNSPGLVDNSFCGNDDQIYILAYALRDSKIKKNARIAQFRIIENMPEIEFEEVESLESTNRGGFGSTGTK
jgi:dUTP pyrophosphatase